MKKDIYLHLLLPRIYFRTKKAAIWNDKIRPSIYLSMFFISAISLTMPAYSQELPVYNEYHLNKSLINPAIIGSEACTWIKATDRHQWVGIENAPTIQTLSFETSLYKKKVVRETDKKIHGIGGYVYNDQNGTSHNMGVNLSYAYHIYINKAKSMKLGLGLSFGISQISLDERSLHGDNNNNYDPIINGNINSITQPDIGFGAFLYNSKFYAGLSGARFLSSLTSSGNIATPVRNYFFITGYLTGTEKSNIRVLPSIVVKAREDLSKQIDLNCRLLMKNVWWFGLSYRHNFDIIPGQPTAILPMAGVNIGQLMVGYAYEYTPGKIRDYNYGTHEITLSYRFCNDGFRCPVYR
jgi:type IX secretion system PorP/SprF family membrane protein